MKTFRLIALSALVTVGAAFSVLYTSCSKDECKDVICKNGGTCEAGICKCPIGYIGSSCETRAFVGTWDGSDACGGTSFTYTMSIANGSDSVTMLVTNAGGFGASNVIRGTLSADARTITYTNQLVSGIAGTLSYTDTITGSFFLTSNTTLTNTYQDHAAGAVYSCNGNFTKL